MCALVPGVQTCALPVSPVPEDPRGLVVPGVNAGKAVLMNAYWQTCQADDHPATCGVLRERAERGFRLVVGNGEIGAGTMFGADSPDPSFAIPAAASNTNRKKVLHLISKERRARQESVSQCRT